MFGFWKGALWRALTKAMGSTLDKKMRGALGNLRGVLTSSVADLAAALAESKTVWKGPTDRIENKKSKDKIELRSVQLSDLTGSKAIAAEFEKKLRRNTELMAAIGLLNLSPRELDTLFANYAKAFVEHATGKALEQLARNETKIFANYVVLGVAENEPYQFKGQKPAYYTQVKLSNDRDLKKAQKYWRNRESSGYVYSKNVFAE